MIKETYPLLREAYAIIDGIPDDRFNLDLFRNSCDPHYCGTIACAAGWLAMHPTFMALGLLCSYPSLVRVLGIPKADAYSVFSGRKVRLYEPEGSETMTDKQLWQARVREFLETT